MLRITRIANSHLVTLKLEGALREPWITAFRQACDAEPQLTLDLSDVHYVDTSGESALRELRERRGVIIGACSNFVVELLQLVKP
jgi:ABC-type transporter Mla MlaB component